MTAPESLPGGACKAEASGRQLVPGGRQLSARARRSPQFLHFSRASSPVCSRSTSVACVLHAHAGHALLEAALPSVSRMSCLVACSAGAARATPVQARGAGRRVVSSAPYLPRAPSAARCTLAWGCGSRQRACVSRGTVLVAAADADDDEPWEVDLQVTGMVCEGCVSNVEAALSKSKGVVGVKVDLASGIATVEVQAATAVRRPRWPALSRGTDRFCHFR